MKGITNTQGKKYITDTTVSKTDPTTTSKTDLKNYCVNVSNMGYFLYFYFMENFILVKTRLNRIEQE